VIRRPSKENESVSDLSRREILRAFLRGVLPTAGTAVLAVAVVPAVQACVDRTTGDALERADRLAAAAGQAVESNEEFCRFVNGAFRKGGFVNGGFNNAGFRKGSFNNGGGFKNGGFVNGGFRNG
jgi:hypothetical protein